MIFFVYIDFLTHPIFGDDVSHCSIVNYYFLAVYIYIYILYGRAMTHCLIHNEYLVVLLILISIFDIVFPGRSLKVYIIVSSYFG